MDSARSFFLVSASAWGGKKATTDSSRLIKAERPLQFLHFPPPRRLCGEGKEEERRGGRRRRVVVDQVWRRPRYRQVDNMPSNVDVLLALCSLSTAKEEEKEEEERGMEREYFLRLWVKETTPSHVDSIQSHPSDTQPQPQPQPLSIPLPSFGSNIVDDSLLDASPLKRENENKNENKEEENEEVFEVEIVPDLNFGLGLRLDNQRDRIFINNFKRHPLSNAPMSVEASGRVHVGDELMAVEAQPLRGKTLAEVVTIIRNILTELGGEGAAITLLIGRPSAEKVLIHISSLCVSPSLSLSLSSVCLSLSLPLSLSLSLSVSLSLSI
jgi:hypothetical protein